MTAPPRPGSRVEARSRRRRGNWTAGAAILLAAGALAAVVTGFLIMSRELESAHRDVALLTQQVENMGGTPVAGPQGETGAAGLIGPPGATGPTGPPGPSGKPAPTITPSPGPAGPPGPTGPVGPMGPAGVDSTIPGPTGPAGQDGADGAPGQDGSDGTDGKDGAPPSEWTYTDQDGREYRCTPVAGFDPDHPRYHCTQTAGPSQSPEPSPTPSQEPSQEPTPDDNSSSRLLPLGLLDRRRT